MSLWSSKGSLLVLQRDVGCHCGPPTGHCWSSNGILVSYCHHWVSNSVLQRDTVGPPKGRWMSPWSSKGTLLVLQRDVGCHCGPPTGHCWSSNEILVSCCHCWVSLWSSKGTLSVLQRDIDATVVLQGDTVSPPRGHCWSSRGTTWGVSVVLQSPPPPLRPPNKDVNVGRSPRLLLWGNLGGIRCFLGLHPTHLGVQTPHIWGFRPIDWGLLPPHLGCTPHRFGGSNHTFQGSDPTHLGVLTP